MKRKSKKKGQKKGRKKGAAGKTLFFLIVIGLGLFLAYQFRKQILESLEPFLKKTPEKRLKRRAEREPEKKTGWNAVESGPTGACRRIPSMERQRSTRRLRTRSQHPEFNQSSCPWSDGR